MKKSLLLSTTILCLLINSTLAQVSVIVSSIPDNTPENDSLYIVGNFNDWNPADSSYILEQQSDNTYKVELPTGSGELKYKFNDEHNEVRRHSRQTLNSYNEVF